MSDQKGMLFKREIKVPEGVAVEMLLQKWNPGLPDYAIEDMLVSVLRWNSLQSFDDLRADQEILIPSVVPPGQTPRQWRDSQKDYPRRKPFSIGGASFDEAAPPPTPTPIAPMTAAPSRPPGIPPILKPVNPPMQKPLAPPRPAAPMVHRSIPGASLMEHKLRQTATAPGPWQASNQTGQTMGGSDVKEQFQRQMQQEMLRKRAMSRKF